VDDVGCKSRHLQLDADKTLVVWARLRPTPGKSEQPGLFHSSGLRHDGLHPINKLFNAHEAIICCKVTAVCYLLHAIYVAGKKIMTSLIVASVMSLYVYCNFV